MEEVRQLVQEEGREARNLVAFHVAVDTPGVSSQRRQQRARRPPPAVQPPPPPPPGPRPSRRLRSASAGRDKRSDLRARYWALLFGDLQRSIGEIYNTVEIHENLSECQEVILVLENYTRDFKALCEWFRLKWEYDNTPPLQRPLSLAWEIRKTDFVRPESRKAHSVKSSPSVSGKNSPCFSGHNTPSGKSSPGLLTGKTSPGSGKISPRISQSITSPKGSVEFFSNKISGKVTAVPEPKLLKEASTLSDITEKPLLDEKDDNKSSNDHELDNTEVEESQITEAVKPEQQDSDENTVTVEFGTAKACQNDSPKPVVIQSNTSPKKDVKDNLIKMSSQAQTTIAKLEEMENEFLSKQLIANTVRNENILNEDRVKNITEDEKLNQCIDEVESDNSPIKVEVVVTIAEVHQQSREKNNEDIKNKIIDSKLPDEKVHLPTTVEADTKKLETKAVSSEVKPSATKPAYSQAAAKPKLVTSSKVETKGIKSTFTPLVRSKTVIERVPKQFPKKNQSSKCSYPFNLTTGRTSLFDTSSPKAAIRKSTSRISHASSVDNKAKQETNKPSQKRPNSLQVDKVCNDNSESPLEKLKDSNVYGSSDTVITQIEMCRIESSESLRTLVPEDVQFYDDITTSVEVLNVDGDTNDNDGWLTVKSRRVNREAKKHSKSHWANRFNQPSATTSLPTLNMLESPKQEDKPLVEADKIPISDRAKSEQPQSEFTINVKEDIKIDTIKDLKDSTAIIRQKSDVTGLKTRVSRNKVYSKKTDKIKDSPKSEEDSPELKKNRLHSSLESLTTALSRSQESTEEPFDFDKWKAEFKCTFKYLEEEEHIPAHSEIFKSADPSEMSEIAAMTSEIEENERKISIALDFQSEVDQQKLCAEEDALNRQIRELQQVSDVDLDTETDDTETDAEILCEDARNICPSVSPISEGLGPLAASLEDQYEPALAGMSWAERVDTLAALEALVARFPGRAQQLHAKLSQGIRRRGSLQETLKRYQAKQARAEQQRLELKTERSKRIHQLLTRVEEVKAAKNQVIEEKRLRMERRLQKATANRDEHLKGIVRKAHDEDEKLREIAFIKQLEAQHRRQDFVQQCAAHTARLRELRRRRLAALKERRAQQLAAVGARRAALQAARRERVQALVERRVHGDGRREARRRQLQLERGRRGREREAGARERLRALAAAAQAQGEALRVRIQRKHLEHRRRLAALRATRAQTSSESQDGQPSKEEPDEDEPEFSKEKLKAFKKKTRKLKQKILAVGQEFEYKRTPMETMLVFKQQNNRLCKVLSQLNNIIRQYIIPPEDENQYKKEEKQNENATNEKALCDDEPKSDSKSKSKKKSKKSKNNETSAEPFANDGERLLADPDNLTVDDIIANNETNLLVTDEPVVEKPSGKSKNKKKNQKAAATEEAATSHQLKFENVLINNSSDNESVATSSSQATSKSKKLKKNAKKNKNKQDTENNVLSNDMKERAKLEESFEIPDNIMKEIDLVLESEAKETNQNSASKKNKGKKGKNDGSSKEMERKLSKVNSECSSETSSRLSANDRAKFPFLGFNQLDMHQLERVLNELNRIVEKFEKTIVDQTPVLYQKFQCVRLLGHMLLSTVDRNDSTCQLSTKALTAAAASLWRVAAVCCTSAAYFLNTNAAAYVVRLLQREVEKDLSNPKDGQLAAKLAAKLADSLSVAFDAVLSVTRLQQEASKQGRETSHDERQTLLTLKRRTHSLISYLCCSGSIFRTERAGDAKDNIYTLITMCINLCIPTEYDTAQEACWALGWLRSALGESLGGAREAFCALLAEPCAASVRVARIARLLRALAELDHTVVQNAFGSGAWPLEFRAAIARLLSEHTPNDREPPRKMIQSGNKRVDESLSEAMVLDLIVLIGFFVVDNPQHQDSVYGPWSVVKTLCNVPANWIVCDRQRDALLPTLLALKQDPVADAVISSEMSTQMLEDYIESPNSAEVRLVQVLRESRRRRAAEAKNVNKGN